MRTTLALSLAVTFVVTSCGRHSFPEAGTIPNNPAKQTAFVDQDGTFYPDKPEKYITSRKFARGDAHSLRQSALLRGGKPLYSELLESEREVLQRFSVGYEGKERIFIFVHGFNNSPKVADKNYALIEEKIKFRESDGIVRFHWDGLVAPFNLAFISTLAIWDNSTGYSSMAGQFGLRRLLNQFQNKEIYLIAHSRGASTILSALSNPQYFSNFESETVQENRFPDAKGTALASIAPKAYDNGNKLKLILFAPAIGEPDFRGPEGQTFRDLGSQIASISYTVNSRDIALQKGILGIERDNKNNSTTMGFKGLPEMDSKYPNVRAYPITDVRSHGLKKYVNSEKFPLIMKEAGLELREDT